MSLLTLIKAQFGKSSTPANNFVLDASAGNGTLKLARGNAGATTQDLITVSANNIITGGSGAILVGNAPIVTANQLSGSSLVNNAFTKVIYGNELIDTANSFNPVTSELTIKIAGVYHFSWSVSAAAASGMLISDLVKNTARVAIGSSGNINVIGAVSVGSALIRCSVGDVFAIRAFQNTGGAVNTGVDATFFQSILASAN